MIRFGGRGGKREPDILYVAPSSAIFPLPLELQVETHELFWRLFCSGFFEFPLGVKWDAIAWFAHFLRWRGSAESVLGPLRKRPSPGQPGGGREPHLHELKPSAHARAETKTRTWYRPVRIRCRGKEDGI